MSLFNGIDVSRNRFYSEEIRKIFIRSFLARRHIELGLKSDRKLYRFGEKRIGEPLWDTAKPEKQVTVPSSVHLEYSCPGFLLDVIMRALERYFRSSSLWCPGCFQKWISSIWASDLCLHYPYYLSYSCDKQLMERTYRSESRLPLIIT